ncbi:MAG TPA: Ig-like domain-containing protein, partial [Acidimicrobiia bacterium]|nr:Ig-like domain-containing protein [Acidimicrobiia bacterium]
MASKGFRSAVARRGAALGLAALLVTATVGSLVLRAAGRATASGTSGYWLAGVDGGVFNYGLAAFHGSAGSVALNSPIVGFVPTPSSQGYWMVAGDGGIFAFGDAVFLGSTGGQSLNKPITAMAATPSGRGYWLVASDGGVFAFGDAAFHGSMAGERLSKPIVDFARTPTGAGYWMTTADGQVYGFGDAPYYGSVGAVDLSKRIQALVPTPTGKGYWLAGADGGIFAFGDAPHLGAAAGQVEKRVIDMAPTDTGRGYYLATANGQVLAFGDATSYGDASESDLNSKIISMATVLPAGGGLEAVEDVVTGQEDAPLSIDPLGNDKAPAGGGSLTLQGITPPGHGTAEVAGNKVSYVPAVDYHGADSFTYTVTGGSGGGSTTGTVRLTVAPVDDKPDAVDDKVNITDGAPVTIDVVANDTGLGDGLKAVTLTQEPGHGTASVGPDNRIAYTPESGFNGTDGLEYRVVDADDDVSSTGKVAITIGGANHLPVAADDELSLRSGRDYTVNVTSNDDVADGVKEVRFADAAGAPIDSVDISTGAGGKARRSGSKITYTAPTGSFTGSDSFNYVVVDSGGDVSKPAAVRATVLRNQAPQVKDGSVAVPQNRQAVGSIAKLGWDPEKDSITFALRSSPAGQLTLKPDGSFVYEAPSGVDVDNFTFVANDGNSDSGEGQLRIQITDTAAASSSSSTTATTAPDSDTGDSSSSTTGPSTTSTTRRSSTTTTTENSTTTSTTASSETTETTRKPSGKSKKQSNSS